MQRGLCHVESQGFVSLTLKLRTFPGPAPARDSEFHGLAPIFLQLTLRKSTENMITRANSEFDLTLYSSYI